MNPHAAHPSSLKALVQSLWSNRSLIYQMANREVVGRYRGSAMGLMWSFLNPVFMLMVYTYFLQWCLNLDGVTEQVAIIKHNLQ